MSTLILWAAVLAAVCVLAERVFPLLKTGRSTRRDWRRFDAAALSEVEGNAQRCQILKASYRRAGFTLVELLVVVTIIGIIASMALAALSQARGTARKHRTRATIAKLHDIVVGRYASYQTRRLPVHTDGMQPNAAAVMRLSAFRQTMRLEMPDRFSDIRSPDTIDPADPGYLPGLLPNSSGVPVKIVQWDGSEYPQKIARPALSRNYLRILKRAEDAGGGTNQYASAECLYMIVAADPESRGMFGDTEIGDADADGLPEFLDGWGNPIYFLRWAPGYCVSSVQPNVMDPFDLSAAWDDAAVEVRKDGYAHQDHDPFDGGKVDMGEVGNPANPPRGWRLIPLIVSAGPDGIYDISFSLVMPSGDPYIYEGNPYKHPVGLPIDMDNDSVTAPSLSNGSIDSWDNFTNHGGE